MGKSSPNKEIRVISCAGIAGIARKVSKKEMQEKVKKREKRKKGGGGNEKLPLLYSGSTIIRLTSLTRKSF